MQYSTRHPPNETRTRPINKAILSNWTSSLGKNKKKKKKKKKKEKKTGQNLNITRKKTNSYHCCRRKGIEVCLTTGQLRADRGNQRISRHGPTGTWKKCAGARQNEQNDLNA